MKFGGKLILYILVKIFPADLTPIGGRNNLTRFDVLWFFFDAIGIYERKRWLQKYATSDCTFFVERPPCEVTKIKSIVIIGKTYYNNKIIYFTPRDDEQNLLLIISARCYNI